MIIINKSHLSELTNIEIATPFHEEGSTIIRCIYTASDKYVNGGWVSIWPSTYLSNSASNVKLPLLHAFNIPIAPHKHYCKRVGEIVRFTLLFPPFPADWVSFNFDEETDNGSGFRFKNIQRSNNGVYMLFIH